MILCHLFEDVAGCWRSGEGGKRGGEKVDTGREGGQEEGNEPCEKKRKAVPAIQNQRGRSDIRHTFFSYIVTIQFHSTYSLSFIPSFTPSPPNSFSLLPHHSLSFLLILFLRHLLPSFLPSFLNCLENSPFLSLRPTPSVTPFIYL